MSRTLSIGGHTVEISHPDKVYFPDAGITKDDVVDYYRRIAEVMLPHLEDRPLTMHRYPEGIDGFDFIQQERPDHLPDWVGGATLPKREGGELTHTVVDSAAALVEIANLGCLTPHIWLSRVDRAEHPDQMIFDLDPSDGSVAPMREAALALRDLLEEIGLAPLVKTSGSRGFHVVVPLERGHDFDRVRALARRVAEILVDRHPDTLTLEQRKNKRGDRIFVDTLRNAYGQHAVAPYALRARPGAPVATPLRWQELESGDVEPRSYTLRNLFRRLGQMDDPWSGAWRDAGDVEAAEGKLEELEKKIKN